MERFRSLQDDFNVRILILYRRPAGWFPSMYKQYRKLVMYSSRKKRYKDYDTSRKGKDTPSTPPTFSKYLELWQSNPIDQGRDTLTTIEFFTTIFGQEGIQILDYHAPNLGVEFVCQGLVPPQESHSCAVAQTLTLGDTTNQNSFLLYDEDLVIMEAYQQGLISKDHAISRHEATVKLHAFWESTRDSLPQMCLTTLQMDWLWNQTLYMEHAIAPNPSLSIEALRDEFDQEASTKFCHVDAVALLQNDTYRNFLSSCAFVKPNQMTTAGRQCP